MSNKTISITHQSLQTQEHSRAFWVDVMRVMATFLVLVIHASADPLMRFHELSSSHWWAADGYSSLTRIAVPWFFMLSGALLLPRLESLQDFFSKRFRKVLIHMVLWSGFYLLWSGSWPESLNGWLRFLFTPLFTICGFCMPCWACICACHCCA